MRTSKPISTISYNSEAYLASRLQEARASGKIRFWTFVRHFGEDDEGGKKDHFHVFIEPSSRIDADKLLADFAEVDLAKPDKPLRCLSPRTSDFGNWYRYALHDESYLAAKLQTRKYHYKPEDFKYSDCDEMNMRIRSIVVENTQIARLKRAVEVGMTFNQALWNGLINPQNVRNLRLAFGMLQREFMQAQSEKSTSSNVAEHTSPDCVRTLEDVDLPFDGTITTLGERPLRKGGVL